MQDDTMRRYCIEDDLLYIKGWRIVVSNKGGLRRDFMKEAHDSALTWHPDFERMLALLSRVFFGKNGR